jgi:hypothetical protein
MAEKIDFGVWMPYAIPFPPWEYKGAKMWATSFKLKEKIPLPEPLEHLDPPYGAMAFATYDTTDIGPYDELLLYVFAKDKRTGTKGLFCPLVYVNSENAYLGGRDMWGFNKKFAEFEFYIGEKMVSATMYRKKFVDKEGERLVDLVMEIGDDMTVEDMREPWPIFVYWVYKPIFTPRESEVHLSCQLVEMSPPFNLLKFKKAQVVEAKVYPTDDDPIGMFLPEEDTFGWYAELDMTFVPGKVSWESK